MSEPIFIKSSFLWDGNSDRLLPGGAVITEGRKIKAVGTFADFDMSSIKLIDCAGLTVLPGLIDCHTHHSMDASLENYLDRMDDNIQELTLRAAAMMKKDLQAGVTICRTLGDKKYLDITCKNVVENGLLEGPRSIVAGKGIRASGGHGYVGYPCDGPKAIKGMIKENLRAGVDLIKIYITGSLKRNGEVPCYLTRDEIQTAVDTSHNAGLKVAAHCTGGVGLDRALELGVDTIEHAFHINDRQIEQLMKSGSRLVLTLSPILNDEIVNHYPQHLIQNQLDERDEMTARMAAIINAGLPFALGSDGLHGELAAEAEYVVKLGASNLNALKALTSNAAEVCGVEKESGCLEAGKYADIIAVEGNPLEDVRSLKKIRMVMRQGHLVSDEITPVNPA